MQKEFIKKIMKEDISLNKKRKIRSKIRNLYTLLTNNYRNCISICYLNF